MKTKTWRIYKKTNWQDFKNYIRARKEIWAERCIWMIVSVTIFVLFITIYQWSQGGKFVFPI